MQMLLYLNIPRTCALTRAHIWESKNIVNRHFYWGNGLHTVYVRGNMSEGPVYFLEVKQCMGSNPKSGCKALINTCDMSLESTVIYQMV